MKRVSGSRAFYILMILFILITFSILWIRFGDKIISGNLMLEYSDETSFYFVDKLSGCDIEGDVYIDGRYVGRTIDSRYKLVFDENSKHYLQPFQVTIKGDADECFGQDSSLPISQTWEMYSLSSNDYDNFNLVTELRLRDPMNIEEKQGYVRPNEAKDYLDSFTLQSGAQIANVDKIAKYQMFYRSDLMMHNLNEYWQTPAETLKSRHGDCEDWAVAVLSLIRAYNAELKCYNILFDSHVSVFCYIDKNYIIYDQDKTKFSIRLIEDTDYNTNKVHFRKMLDNYFDSFGIRNSERKVLALFNDEEAYEFKENDEFIDFVMGIGYYP